VYKQKLWMSSDTLILIIDVVLKHRLYEKRQQD
jgi:hypothetical protein